MEGRRPKNRPNVKGDDSDLGLATRRDSFLTAETKPKRGTLETAWVARLSRQLHRSAHLSRPCPLRLRSSLAMPGCAMNTFSSCGPSEQAATLHLPVVLTVFQQGMLFTDWKEIAACENDVYFSVMSVSDILVSSLNDDITHATDVMNVEERVWIWWSYVVCRMWPLLRPAGVL